MGKHIDNRYDGKLRDKEKLKNRAKNPRSNAYFDEQSGRYKEWSWSKGTKRKKWLKNMSNRKIRRTDDIPTGKSQYQKLYEYVWGLC